MNDRFRFRVVNNRDWEEDYGKLFYNAEETYDYCNDIKASSFGALLEDGWIVEQCTGLKDKNGKLIYEGDVVEAVVQNHYKLKGIICWEIDRYQIKELNAPVLFDLYEALYDSDTGFAKNSIEVIGNIHENPELLEK